MRLSVEHIKRKRCFWFYWQPIYTLEEDLRFFLPDRSVISVPKGYKTDGATVPWLLRWLYRQDGPWMKWSVLHDYLYDTQKVSRWEADAIYLHHLLIDDRINNTTAVLFFIAVRIGGKKWYNN